MACLGGPSDPTRKHAEKAAVVHRHDLVKTEVLLCEACRLLEAAGLVPTMSRGLRSWMNNHEAFESDRIRQKALKKLTPRERRVLGIDSGLDKT